MQSRTKNLAKNTAILFLGRFCTQFISFLLVPIYTRFLSTDDYGYVDLIHTYILLIAPIIILRLDSGIFRFLIDARNDEKDKKNITSSIITFSLIQAVLFSIIFITISNFIEIKYALFMLLNTLAIMASSIALQASRGLGDNLGYSIASIITGIMTLILNTILIIIYGFNASSILISSTAGNAIGTLFIIFKSGIHKQFSFKNINTKRLKEILGFSVPMIPDGLSWWVVGVSDRTIISAILGTAANGIYAISSKFSNVLFSIFQVFNMSWQENASLHINDKDNNEYFTNILNTTHKLFFSICYLLLGAMPFVFMIMVGDNYREAYQYVPILLFANLLNTLANTTGAVYIAKKKSSSAAKTTLAAAIINIIINLLFVRILGLYAAAISTLISYALLALYRYYDVQKYVKMKIDDKFFIVSTIIFMASSIIYMRNNIILNIINLLVIAIVCIFINKKLIKKTAKRIIDKIAKKAL